MKLQFLSLVDVATIPLYLAAGPSLNVWTQNESTEHWLSESLLDDWDLGYDTAFESTGPWWLRPVQQSDRGILLRVEDDAEAVVNAGHRITEFLIYAALCKEPELCNVLPTPPGSSSPGADPDIDISRPLGIIRDIKIHALPLSSYSYTQIEDCAGLDAPSLYDNLNVGEARFLPATSENALTVLASPQKRQRISTMFEDATYQRKRQMGHGGDRISRAMAEIDGSMTNREPLKTSTLEDVRQNPFVDQMKEKLRSTPRGNLSRSSSETSLRIIESSRPPSRRGALTSGKRSSLHRVESIMSTGETFQVPAANTIEQQNKCALSRIVMTGMRIYGLQQKKKSIKPQIEQETEASFRESSRPPEEEDDYKLIYHQTFKAASFTFRARIALEIINQEAMRDVVDRLLCLFCNDPLTVHNTSDTFNDNIKLDNRVTTNCLDSTSITARLSEAQDFLCFPPVRRRLPSDSQTGEVSMCKSASLLSTASPDH